MATTNPTRRTTRKKTSKKVETVEQEVKTKIVLPPGLQDEKVGEQIITLLIGKKKIAAIQAYRFATGMGLKEASDALNAWWKDYQLTSIDPSTYPEHCCYHCIGCCGRLDRFKADYGNKLWDSHYSCPLGTSCDKFMTEATFNEKIVGSYKNSGITIVFKSVGDGYRSMRLSLDDPILKTEAIYDRRRESDSCRILSIGKAREDLLKLALEYMLTKGWAYDGVAAFSGSLRYRGCEPNTREGWEAYIQRANQEIVGRRVEISDRFNAMPMEEVDAFLLAHIKKRGLDKQLKAFGDDLDWFLNEFFPGLEHREIAVTFLRDELG